MSLASDLLKRILVTDFPQDAKFLGFGSTGQVGVQWTIQDAAGANRRNAPFVVNLEAPLLALYRDAEDTAQINIETRIRAIVAKRFPKYEAGARSTSCHHFIIRIAAEDI